MPALSSDWIGQACGRNDPDHGHDDQKAKGSRIFDDYPACSEEALIRLPVAKSNLRHRRVTASSSQRPRGRAIHLASVFRPPPLRARLRDTGTEELVLWTGERCDTP